MGRSRNSAKTGGSRSWCTPARSSCRSCTGRARLDASDEFNGRLGEPALTVFDPEILLLSRRSWGRRWRSSSGAPKIEGWIVAFGRDGVSLISRRVPVAVSERITDRCDVQGRWRGRQQHIWLKREVG